MGNFKERRRVRKALCGIQNTAKSAEMLLPGREIPGEIEWLLDNAYLAQREGQQAIESLQNLDCKAAFEAARAFLNSDNRQVSAAALERFLDSWQEDQPLSEQELCAFPPALRAELVSRVRDISARAFARFRQGEPEKEKEEIAFCFKALRDLSALDFSAVLERVSRTERLLQKDPAGIYPQMDEATRGEYRRRLTKLARKNGCGEVALAEALLQLARTEDVHIGNCLFPIEGNHENKGGFYIAAILISSFFLTLLAGFVTENLAVTLLLLLPVSETVKNVLDCLILRLVRPRYVPRMDGEKPVPQEAKTLCVVSALLTGEESGRELAALLEEYRLANRACGENLLFALLADLPEGKKAKLPGDREKIQAAAQAISALNDKYGGFGLFLRERRFSPADKLYMGWERKRGALLELMRHLRGMESGLTLRAGTAADFEGVKFVIMLDADTRLNVGAAGEMIAAMRHPLNKPVVEAGRVIRGHGLLAPRIGTELASASVSDFARVFAGQGGTDPYASRTSDLYYDLYGEGTFSGKGILDVDAYIACLDSRFPENRILSHDLLEGAFLRCAFLSDVELSDGFPGRVLSYFARLHRWIRGDWQAARWMFRHVPDAAGKMVKNDLPQLDRWKLADNLRRSLVPAATFAALLTGLLCCRGDFLVAAAAALLSAGSGLLISFVDSAARRGSLRRRRFHASLIHGFGGVIMRLLLKLAFLPYKASLCMGAVITALYRMLITKRKLLEWTTAAESEHHAKNKLGHYYRKMWPSAVAGAFVIGFSPYPFGITLGLYWLIGPLIAWSVSRERKYGYGMKREDRLYLMRCAGNIWRYFQDFLCAEDNFLPPDNVQEIPEIAVAHRTSPTNIGLALLSVLSAADLGLCSEGEMQDLLGNMLDSIERLPKWQGHLYNWYDSRSLQPLQPPYISSVDSGNLAGCLVALKQGLSVQAPLLAQRADRLLKAMDFALLYDPVRRLFRIGIEPGKDKQRDGHYDLLASEARLTSYYAVAAGQVPARHWRRLGRGITAKGGYSGLLSWTGTMFEYLMPNLLLPCYEDSLLWESLQFCIRMQKAEAGALPWGISESAYNALDAGGNYKYKAHGSPTLALKRGMEADRVVSPYSTFLALPWQKKSALVNLRRMAAMGAEGRWGFVEALDFTEGRRMGKEPALVRTYMAHHLGMSLISITNTLLDGIMCRRFMADEAMAAYRGLLQEKIPVKAPVMKRPAAEIPQLPRRRTGQGWQLSGQGTDWKHPRGTLLSNGIYNLLILETGASRSICGRKMITRFEHKRSGASSGMSFYYKSESGLRSLQPAPLFQEDAGYNWYFSGARAEIRGTFSVLESAVISFVSGKELGEKRIVCLKNTGKRPAEGILALYFEPVLEEEKAYFSHPAFSKLGLETEISGNRVLIRRRGSASCACLISERSMEADTARELALGRGGEWSMQAALERESRGSSGAVLDPCVLVRVPICLQPGEETSCSFALAYGEDAAEAAERILHEKVETARARLDYVAENLGMAADEIEAAMDQIPNLVFSPLEPNAEAGGQQSLWPYGISGDYPLFVQTVADKAEMLLHLKRLALLYLCGLRYDLALLIDDGGDYRRPMANALSEAMREAGLEALKNCFVVDRAGCDVAPLLAMAVNKACSRELSKPDDLPAQSLVSAGEYFSWRFDHDGSFVFSGRGALPPNCWSHILTNGSFGALAADSGCGHVWSGNARENRLTPWINDSLAILGPERLFANGKSAFPALDDAPYTVRYGLGYASWEKNDLSLTAFVPIGLPARILLLENTGQAEKNIRLYLETEDKLARIEHQDGVSVIHRAAEDEFPETSFRVFTDTGEDPFAGFALKHSACLVVGDGIERGDFSPERVRQLLEETKAFWQNKLCRRRFSSPWKSLNDYMNGWVQYQAMACRLWGRCSIYQSGGAYGFRDQLQDVCGLLEIAPELARNQILLACAHQYKEGDVQHWWHETQRGDRGVRTRCSDDLLWLPYAAAAYLEKTGDKSILQEKSHWLISEVLAFGEQDRYERPEQSAEADTVLEHCLRALDLALKRGRGAHGLPFIGNGDWNDGYSKVGAAGRGESVWLAWFQALVLKKFLPWCPEEKAAVYAQAAEALLSAAENCWDGDRFIRGYYDDGRPLGAKDSREGAMDSIAQSFAALAGCRDEEKVKTALETAVNLLFDRENKVVKLLSPAFSGAEPDPGYISRYPEGVRENGGQYTHAAIWLAMACFETGKRELGIEILLALLPRAHPWEKYRVEPYVLAADVYSHPQHIGRGGWSWYTGAAGWYLQAVQKYLPEYFSENSQ